MLFGTCFSADLRFRRARQVFPANSIQGIYSRLFDVMMAKRKMSLNELSEKVDLTLSNLSILKTGKAKAIRFTTLDAVCKALDCQPGDILEYADDGRRTTNR